MSGAEALVPLMGTVCLFTTIFGVVYLKSRENMALIERNINPRETRRTPKPYINLKYGLLLAGAGLGLLIAFIVDLNVNHRAVLPGGEVYQQDYPQIYFSLIALFGGLGLILSYRIEKKEWLNTPTPEREGEEGPVYKHQPYDKVTS